MRTRMFSPFLLLVGLTLGLLAMWASASPLGATGDLVTGGWVACTIDSEDTWFATPSEWHCENHCYSERCSNDYSSTCSGYDEECTGGSITVISCYLPGPYDFVVYHDEACQCPYAGGTFWISNANCY